MKELCFIQVHKTTTWYWLSVCFKVKIVRRVVAHVKQLSNLLSLASVSLDSFWQPRSINILKKTTQLSKTSHKICPGPVPLYLCYFCYLHHLNYLHHLYCLELILLCFSICIALQLQLHCSISLLSINIVLHYVYLALAF